MLHGLLQGTVRVKLASTSPRRMMVSLLDTEPTICPQNGSAGSHGSKWFLDSLERKVCTLQTQILHGENSLELAKHSSVS